MPVRLQIQSFVLELLRYCSHQAGSLLLDAVTSSHRCHLGRGTLPKVPPASRQSCAAALGVALCVAGDTWPAEIRLLFSARTSRGWDETQPFAGPGWPPKDDHHWAVSCYDTKETFVCD